MDDYWKNYWKKHAQATINQDLLSQVMRTLNKKPIERKLFERILNYVENRMELSSEDQVLDLCCGNGLITTYLASKCKQVVGVDFTEELVKQINLEEYPNISIIVEDVTNVDFKANSFSKVMIHGSLQHFDRKEVISLFKRVYFWLKNDGLFFMGDVPDEERVWSFYNSEDRERVYFDSIINDRFIIGHWFNAKWLEKLGKYSYFKDATAFQQPPDFPYAYFRFDMILRKESNK